jgi:hypothetical protein
MSIIYAFDHHHKTQHQATFSPSVSHQLPPNANANAKPFSHTKKENLPKLPQFFLLFFLL